MTYKLRVGDVFTLTVKGLPTPTYEVVHTWTDIFGESWYTCKAHVKIPEWNDKFDFNETNVAVYLRDYNMAFVKGGPNNIGMRTKKEIYADL